MATIRAGQEFGDWTTVGDKHLGRGGNGDVWEVEGVDGRAAAIKVLTRRGGRDGAYRLDRFKDEIRFLLKFPDFPGVLPILDHHLSDDPRRPSWYIMPLATPIREALGGDAEPIKVIDALAAISRTLEDLASRHVYHRDVKPDNLFKLNGNWVIGDFGLVTYPKKNPLTEHGRKLGPIDYMAPEMRADADTAAPGPADVWAMGKTLWTLLTGQELPLPGSHLSSDPAQALQERITFPLAAEVDLLLERATQIDPNARVTMSEFARELSYCLLPPAEARPSANLEDLRQRVEALTAASRRSWLEDEDTLGRHHQAFVSLNDIASNMASELNDLLKFQLSSGADIGSLGSELGHENHSARYRRGTAYRMIPHSRSRPPVEIVMSVMLQSVTISETFEAAALVAVKRSIDGGSVQETRELYKKIYRNIPVDSAQQAHMMSEIRASFASSLEPVMRQVTYILSLTGSASDLSSPTDGESD